jgi:hypothetical protein
MINRWLSILAAMLLTSAAPALAQQNFRHRPATDPYRNLFTTPQVSGDTPRVERHLTKKDIPAQRQKPVLNCGMLVVPADPSVSIRRFAWAHARTPSGTRCAWCRLRPATAAGDSESSLS